MSEASMNANANANGGGTRISEIDEEDPQAASSIDGIEKLQPGGVMRVPSSEEESDRMLRAQLGDDPEAYRRMGREVAAKFERLAVSLGGGVESGSEGTLVAQTEAASVGHSVAQPGIALVAAPAPVAQPPLPEPVPPAPVATQPTQPTHSTTQPTAAAFVASTPSAPAPVQPQQQPSTQQAAVAAVPFPPTGYMRLPEGIYTWTPESWGGRVLHAVPDKVIERVGYITLLVFVLLAPAYARNRAGRIVSLPQGGRVIVHAGIAWAPVIPFAKEETGGRPVICARPTFDAQSRQIVYDLGDGGREYGIEITYDPDPKDPSKPRLIDLDVVRGARREEHVQEAK